MSFRGRYSSHSGSSYSQGLISPPCSSPYASPRHSYARSPRKGASAADRTILTIQAVLLVLFITAIWKGISYSTRELSTDLLDNECLECRAQADIPVSDLSIKLATNKQVTRGRKDIYEDNVAGSRGYKQGKGPHDSESKGNAGTLAADNQRAQQQYALTYDSDYQHADAHYVQRRRPQPLQQVQPRQPQQQQHRDSTQSSLHTAADTAAQPLQSHHADRSQQAAGAANASVAVAVPPAPSAGVQQTGSSSTNDPLHESHTKTGIEAEQLTALSKIVQQQQDTISRQSKALLDLQQRFLQQQHQLQAATASAVNNNDTDGVEVEGYLPQERVKQELDMLHNVEAQIEALSAGVNMASKVLPQLTEDQKAAQLADLARAEQYMSRLSRVAAAISLRTSDPLTEAAHDPITQLRHYYAAVASSNVTTSWEDALSRQSRPTAESLGIVHVEPYADEEADLDTLDLRLEYAQAVLTQMHEATPCKLALVTTWSGDLWGLRRELLPWITYHALQGVSKVYVMYEGGDKNTLTSLHDLAPNVRVMLLSPPLATRDDVTAFEAWLRSVPDSHIKEWRSQPGNYQLMTKQAYAVTHALELARDDNVTWLIHMDPDELLHPGAGPSAGSSGTAFSLLPELCGAPAHIPSIRFVNVEGVPEAADIENRYQEVTLFKAHRHLVPPAAQPFRYIFKQGHAESWLHLYTNGKSAVRPDAPGVVQGGPHVFLGPADARWMTPDNPHGIWRPVVSNSTLLLHFAYATPGDVAVKAGRSCPEEVVEAALAGNTAAVSKCFVLDIDKRAFVAAIKDRRSAGLPPPKPPAASTDPSPAEQRAAAAGFYTGRTLLVDDATLAGIKTSNEFSNASWPVGKEVLNYFWGELALSEGAPFECLTPDGKAKGWCCMTDVSKLKSLLISTGLMMRLHAPAQAMKGIEAAVRQLMIISGRTAHPVHPSAAQAQSVKDKEDSGTSAAVADTSAGQQVQQVPVNTAAGTVLDAQPAAATSQSAAVVDSTTNALQSTSADVAAGSVAAGKPPKTAKASASDSVTADVLAHNDNALLISSAIAAEAQLSRGDNTSSASTGGSIMTAGSPAVPTAHSEEPSIWDSVPHNQDSQQQASEPDDHARHGHRSALRDKLLIA